MKTQVPAATATDSTTNTEMRQQEQQRDDADNDCDLAACDGGRFLGRDDDDDAAVMLSIPTFHTHSVSHPCIQRYDAVGWALGRASGL